MAIIYSYPTTTPVGSDTIIGTQQAVDESGDNLTVTFTIASIADYVASSILPSGTPNYLPVFSTASTFIDSPIFVDSFSAPTLTTVGTNLTIAGGSSISNDLTVGGQTLTDTLEVTTSAEIQGELSMGGVINMGGNLINNVSDPVDAQDAATKAYVDANTEEVEFAITLRQPARFQVAVQPGDPVYITGYNVGQGRYEVDLAQAGDPARMPAIGVAADTYGTNDNGYIITHGAAEGINTNAFDVGDTVWVGQFGGLTNIRPSGINLVQNVGVVGKKSGGAGEIEAIALGRTNDVPNIPRGSMWVGDATGVANPLPIGTAGQILVSDGTDVNWQDDDTDVSLTQGSLWIGDAANKKSELAVGSQGQVLVSDGTTAVWQDDDTDISLNDKRIWVGDSSNKQQQSTNIYFDQTSDIYKFGNNHILGLGPSFTFGRYNDASGDYSVALGQFCDATGYIAIAMGNSSMATGNYSFATSGGQASGVYATAIGQGTYASGNASVAIGGGQNTIASGVESYALGDWCVASGTGSVAVGVGTGPLNQTIASGNYSAAFGTEADTSNYNYSTALGYQATNTVEQQTALGQKLLFNEYGSGLVVGTPAYNLFVDASGNVVEAPVATSPVGGAGTANYIPLWQDSSTLVDSVILQDGATANSAVSIGVSNTVSNQSYSIGGSNTSSSVNSVAIGFNNTVDTKNQNLAAGSNNTVSAGNSQALGSQNTALFTLGAPGVGSASSLIGSQNSSDGARVFILGGSNASLTGSNDVAMVGRQNTAANGRTYAFGDANVAAAFRAFAIGAVNTTASQSSLLIGTNNSSDGGIYQHVLGRNNNINYNVGIAAFPSNVVLAGLNNTTQWNNAYHFGRGLGSGAANQVLIGHFAELSTKSLSYVGIGVGSGTSDRLTAMSFKKEQGGGAQIFAEALYNAASYADDTAAAAGGVELGQLYRTGSIVKIRMT